MNLKVLFLIISGFFAVGKSQECEVDDYEQLIYANWPHSISCLDVIDEFSEYFVDEDEESEEEVDYLVDEEEDYEEEVEILTDFTCIITDTNTGNIIFDMTSSYNSNWVHPLGDAVGNSAYTISARDVDNTYCYNKTINFRVIPMPVHASCNEFLEDPVFTPPIGPGTKEGEPKTFTCESSVLVDGTLPPTIDATNPDFHVQWLYNCNTLPNNTQVQDDKLNVNSANHRENPGIYTCAVTYRGMTRYVVNYAICIKPDFPNSSPITVICPDKERTRTGSNVSVNCTINAGLSIQPSNVLTGLAMSFYKLLPNNSDDVSFDNTSCTSNLNDNRTRSPDGRASCVLKTVQIHNDSDIDKCFNDPPTEEQWMDLENRASIIAMELSIENVEERDFGKYRATVSLHSSNDTAIFRISKDTDMSHLILIITVTLVVLGLLIILGILFYIFRLDLQWVWKRYFASYTKDPKPYGCYLAYHWSEEIGRDRKGYNDFIDKLKQYLLDKLHSPIYDDHEDSPVFQYVYQNIKEMQNRCDRIIVLLNEEFLREENFKFQIYTNCIRGLFIFIKVPGMEKVIKELDPQRRGALKALMRQHHVIDWSGQSGLTGKFKRRLEVFMPKRKQCRGRAYENTAQTQAEQNGTGYQANGIGKHANGHANGAHVNQNGRHSNGNGQIANDYEQVNYPEVTGVYENIAFEDAV